MSAENFIIGNGLSGTSASYFLKDYENTIVEKENKSHGRIKSFSFDKNIIDVGAQFFSKEDENISPLVKNLGLENQTIDFMLSDFSIVHKGKVQRLTSNFETMSNIEVKELREFKSFLSNKSEEILKNPSEELILRTFDEWYRENIGSETIWFIRSLVRSITFSSPGELSAFYGLLVCLSFFERCLTIQGGLEKLCQKLIHNSDPVIKADERVTKLVVQDQKVRKIELEGGEDIELGEDDCVVSSIPSKSLVNLLPSSELKNTLENIEYRGCCVAALEIPNPLSEYKENCGSGLLYSQSDGISAVINENKCIGLDSKKGYIAVLRPYTQNEEDIIKKTKAEFREMFPDLQDEIKRSEFFKWDLALPLASPGLFGVVHKIRECNRMENLFICGDYLGPPSLDTCVKSAKEVAKKIKEK